MGISRHCGDAFSIPNLFRNGGLDFQDNESPTPPFYLITGAIKKASAKVTENSWDQVFNESVTQAGAPSNYFKLSLPSPNMTVVGQDFRNTTGGTFDHVIPVDADLTSNVIPFELQPFGYLSEEANLLYQGKFTLSFAIRVPQGKVSLGISWMNDKGESTDPEYLELDSSYSDKNWSRYTGIFDAGKTRLGTIGVYVQRKGESQVVEAHIGNIMLAAGPYDDLPYTGDPAALVFPRGAIIMALGMSCPPGFVPIEQDGMYPRGGPPGATGGSQHHEHDISQTMSPEIGWSKRSLLDSNEYDNIRGIEAGPTTAADPAEAHEHVIADDGANNTEPNFRGLLFCRRV